MASDGDVASTKHTKVSNHSVHNYSVKQTELTAIHDAMFSALYERDATLAGTALIGLELLRSAAIVTLGEVETSDDRELLESYAVAENRQIVDAAKMALEKMDARD